MNCTPNATVNPHVGQILISPGPGGGVGGGSGSASGETGGGGGGGGLWVTSLLGALLLTMCALGVAGNVYTLLIIVRSSALRRAGSMYVYIVNLAVADLLYLFTIPFVVCTYFARDWLFGEVGCRLLLSLDLLTMHASVFVLVAMTLERYRAVARPLAMRGRSAAAHRRKLAAIGVMWAVALALTLPMMVMIKQSEGKPGGGGAVKRICFPTWTPEAFKAYLTVLFLSSALVPGLAVAALYAGLVRHYWRAQASLGGGGGGSSSRRRTGLKRRVAAMILSIVVAYWSCFLPFWGWQLAKLFSPELLGALSPAAHGYVNFSVTCLTYGNSCVNPLLYTLLTRNYRDYLAQRGQPTGSSRVDAGSAGSPGACGAFRGASCD